MEAIKRYLLHEADVTGPQVRPAAYGKAVYGYPASLQPYEFKQEGIMDILDFVLWILIGLMIGPIFHAGSK